MITSNECSIDNKLQALLSLLLSLAVVVQLNAAFYNVTTAYMYRMQAIIQMISDYSNNCRENNMYPVYIGTCVCVTGYVIWVFMHVDVNVDHF